MERGRASLYGLGLQAAISDAPLGLDPCLSTIAGKSRRAQGRATMSVGCRILKLVTAWGRDGACLWTRNEYLDVSVSRRSLQGGLRRNNSANQVRAACEALRDNPVCQARGTSQSSDYESYSGSSPLEPIRTKTGEKSSDLLDHGIVDPTGRRPAIELIAGISHARSTTPQPQLHAKTPRPVRESLREADLDSSSWRMLGKAIGGIWMFAGASTTGVS